MAPSGSKANSLEDRAGGSAATPKEPHMATIEPAKEEDSLQSSLSLAGRRAVAVVFSSYPSDPRPRRGAEALAREGAKVEVICLRETDEEPEREFFNGIDVTRVPLKRYRGGKLSYVLQYGAFILIAGSKLAARAWNRRYDLVHIHNMPDILVFSALVPKILGAKVILDMHDPMPELMMSIFGLRADSFAVRLLKPLEKYSLRFADAVLAVNEACRKIFSARSCPAAKITVVMNSPDEGIFRFRESSGPTSTPPDLSKPFVIMYHGSLVERHGLDLAVVALEKIRRSIPNAELRIYGRSTPFLEQVMNSVRGSELGRAVRHLGPKNLEEIALAIGECDVGIIPNRRSIFTELNTPTRIFEYLSQGKPVVAPRAPGILDYFDSSELVLFELGDADDLAAKIEYVFGHPGETLEIVKRGQQVYQTHKWSSECSRFVHLAKALIQGKERAPARTDGPTSAEVGSTR
jgi:glycosyltransferase involved in cell wall biosynthesis